MSAIGQHLMAIFQAGVDAVSGKSVVKKALLSGAYPDAFHAVAIGKAADAMLQGVPQDSIKSGLLISKHGHISRRSRQDSRLLCIESDHPVPGVASLQAGQSLIAYLENLAEHEACLFLISGGASALVEVLREGYGLSDLQGLNERLLADGFAIGEINAERRKISRIKGGGLWDYLGKRDVSCLMISDVANDDPAVIGSGLLFPAPQNRKLNWQIVASLEDAKQAAAQKARELGYKTVAVPEFLKGSAEQAAIKCVAILKENPGIMFIWGGETTVNLPENPGKGGRNQHLALMAAIEMSGLKNCSLLAAGTDGSDGNTLATGAIVDNETVEKATSQGLDSNAYLQNANSNALFAQTDELLITGATGTNVMDLIIGIYN